MSCLLRRLFALLLIFLFASLSALAELPGLVETLPIPKLHFMAQKSGYIFSGTVKSVERITSRAANSVSVMRITFQVERGFFGVRNGQQLAIHECIGLWQSGQSFRPGEKVLLFLYPPSKLGLTSPVGGMSGRFSVDPGGRIIIDPKRPGVAPLHQHAGAPKAILLAPEDFARALRIAWSQP